MSRTAPYDAREVSNFVLKCAQENNGQITQMTLLKIIFYAHGWFLAAKGTPLFKQPVEAWEYGPVVKVVRDAFKSFGDRPITRPAEKLDLHTGELVSVSADMSPEDENFVRTIFETYSKYSAFRLSDMTHESGTPWDKVWNSEGAVGRLGLRIKNDEIKNYFVSLKARNALH